MAKCKGCGADFDWKISPLTGARIPTDRDTGESHFKTCPNANDFSRSKKKETTPND